MKHKIFSIIILTIFITSCENKVDLTPNLNDFTVSVEQTDIKVGDSVKFYLRGNPDIISFYSGELLHQYDFSNDSRIIDAIKTNLSFKTAVVGAGQKDQLSVLISTDYKNTGNVYADIKAAQWADITNRFKYGTNGVYAPSNEKDISDVIIKDQPFYIGFRYTNKILEGQPRSWFVQSVSIIAKTPVKDNPTDSIDVALNVENNFGGYKLFAQYTDTLSSVSTNTINFKGDPNTPNEVAETWAVSTPFISGNIDIGPDRAIGIKGFFDQKIDFYSYIYNKPGIYNVVFVAKNVNVYQEESVVRSIQINVTE